MEQPLASPAYNRTFEDFNDRLMQEFREVAYGEDIGQHSWTSAAEIRDFCASMQPKDNIIDFGCGASGPLTFIIQSKEGSGTGCTVFIAGNYSRN